MLHLPHLHHKDSGLDWSACCDAWGARSVQSAAGEWSEGPLEKAWDETRSRRFELLALTGAADDAEHAPPAVEGFSFAEMCWALGTHHHRGKAGHGHAPLLDAAGCTLPQLKADHGHAHFIAGGSDGRTPHAVKQAVLVVGGQVEDEFLKSANIYDVAAKAWLPLPCMAHARGGAEVVVVAEGKVVVLGGANRKEGTRLSSCESYDMVEGKWSEVAPMLSERSHFGAATLGGGADDGWSSWPTSIVVAGDGGSSDGAAAERYDIASGVWSALPPMGAERWYSSGAALADGRFVMAGGSNGWGSVTSTAEALDVRSGSWSAIAPMATKRRFFSLEALPGVNQLVASGGSGEGSDSKHLTLRGVELYEARMDRWLPVHQQ